MGIETFYVMLNTYNKLNIKFVRLCVTSNYSLNKINLFNLGNISMTCSVTYECHRILRFPIWNLNVKTIWIPYYQTLNCPVLWSFPRNFFSQVVPSASLPWSCPTKLNGQSTWSWRRRCWTLTETFSSFFYKFTDALGDCNSRSWDWRITVSYSK